jgi:peptidoglycan-associated lipoprotein
MIRNIFSASLTVVLALSMVACSSKKPNAEGDNAGDNSAMAATDMGATQGGAIPELPAVYFEYDSFALTSESKTALSAHADWLKSNSSRRVQVQGHTDERGTTEYNLALGERRAGSVRDFLVGKGVSSGQLNTISFGEERPAMEGTDESAWSRNRRAEFFSAN